MGRSRGIYNKIYTEEKWKKVNPENIDIMEDFLTELRQQKKSKGTIDGYFQDLRIVLIKIMEDFGNKSILEMTKKDFRKLNIWFDDSGMSPARCNRIHSATNSMLTFVEEDDDYDYEINASKKVKGIPNERVKTDENNFFFSFDEFIKVRDILVSQKKYQLAAYWSLSFDSAGRKAEIAQVKKAGILDGNQTNTVRGKRGKMFPLVFMDDTKEIIREYLNQRGDDDIDSLWITGSGDNIHAATTQTLYNWMLQISKILSDVRGVETNIFPHATRHSRLECLSQGTDERLKDINGKNRKFPLEQIMVLAHHSSSDTTRSYLANHDSDIINDMFGFS